MELKHKSESQWVGGENCDSKLMNNPYYESIIKYINEFYFINSTFLYN